MSRIKSIFDRLKQQRTKAFIPFITAGDNGLDSTFELMQTLVANGADIIELGVAFSDPMADGPVIAKSHQRVVEAGVGLNDILDLVKKFRQSNNETAIVLMGYLNPIEVFTPQGGTEKSTPQGGIEKNAYQKFSNAASLSGVDAVLVVDMPPEESHDLKQCLNDNGIDFIFLIAPTTTDNRIACLAKIATGFVYFVALKGVTGAGNLDVDLVNRNLVRIRQFINLPVGVGFGIKDAHSAKQVSENADAVIVGSPIVALIAQYSHDKDKMLASVGALSAEISEAIK